MDSPSRRENGCRNLFSWAGTAGTCNSSTGAIFSLRALFDGTSPFNGSLDEVAFYPTVSERPDGVPHRGSF